MDTVAEHPVLDFYLYPSVGVDDWRYAFGTAKVRSLMIQMLSRAALLDLANAENYEQATDLLSSTEYALPAGSKNIGDLEETLLASRASARRLFSDLIADEALLEPLKTREDFANLRLGLRRKLTDRPIGLDYSNDGSIPAEQFEEIFEVEDYSPLPYHIQEAIERAVLAYYSKKDVREIDYALDASYAEYKIRKALELKNIFILELFRMQIDLINIKTMLRLKFTESEQRNVFYNGGYVEIERLKHGLDIGYEAIGHLFFATPYHHVVETGVSYLTSKKSFLKLERNCEEHINGFLKLTDLITAGPQPLIAYLLMKEQEIRLIRLIMTAKKNNLDTRLILDRLGE